MPFPTRRRSRLAYARSRERKASISQWAEVLPVGSNHESPSPSRPWPGSRPSRSVANLGLWDSWPEWTPYPEALCTASGPLRAGGNNEREVDGVDSRFRGGGDVGPGRGKVSSHRERVIRSLRRRAESLGVDVSGLTDEELEARIVQNSKTLASRVAKGVRETAKEAASRVVALRKSLTEVDENE